VTQESVLIQFDHTNAQHFNKFSMTAYKLYCVQFFVESLRDTLSSYVTPCPGKESEACDGYSVPFILVQNHTITDSLRLRVTGTTTIRSNASGVYLPELKDKFTGQKKKKTFVKTNESSVVEMTMLKLISLNAMNSIFFPASFAKFL